MKPWIFLLAILMAACHQSGMLDRKTVDKEKIADMVLGKVAYQMKQEANLRPCGTMGQMMNEIQRLGLDFFYFQPVDIVQGRRLAVQAVGAMLNEINQEPRIRPYLIRYPFQPRNVEITIFLRNPDNSDPPQDALQVIDASEGVILYQIHNPSETGYNFVTIYKETYQEALDRLADPSLPLAQFEPEPDELSPEEWARLRRNIGFVSDDGAVYHLGEDGKWVKNSQ